MDSEYFDGKTMKNPVPMIPDAESMGNLWKDRRHACVPVNFTDRRSGLDRRVKSVEVENDRRGTTRKDRFARSSRAHSLLLMGGDLAALCFSFVVAFVMFLLVDGDVAQDKFVMLYENNWLLVADVMRLFQFATASFIAITVFWILGHYSRRLPFWDEVYLTSKLILFFACFEATFVFVAELRHPRVWLLGTWVVAIFIIPLMRYLIRLTLANLGLWSRPTAIIGIGRNARETAEALSSEVGLGLYVSVFLVPPPSWGRKSVRDNRGAEIPETILIGGRHIPVRCLGDQPEHALHSLGMPHLVVALDSNDLWEVSKLLLRKQLPYSSLSIAPSIRGLPLIGMEMLHFFKHDVMLMRVQNNLSRRIPQRIKRAFDLCVASLLLIALSPLMLFLIASIRRTGSDAFFGHPRLGQNGKPFKCYKFRTMIPNAQEVLKKLLETDPEARAEWERDFKLKRDPRVTRIGSFLRRTSLDELPQLWNVIRGEMSLVGPRPIIDEELERYANKKDFFLEAKPGITGLWQISGRNDVTYDERVQLDAWYARNWQLWYDIVILIRTIKVVFGKKGAY